MTTNDKILRQQATTNKKHFKTTLALLRIDAPAGNPGGEGVAENAPAGNPEPPNVGPVPHEDVDAAQLEVNNAF